MEKLPNNIINYIYKFLKIADIAKATQSSKLFRTSELLWLDIILRDFGVELSKNFIKYAKDYYHKLYTGQYITDNHYISKLSYVSISWFFQQFDTDHNNIIGTFIYAREESKKIIEIKNKVKDSNVIFYFAPNLVSIDFNIPYLNSIINGKNIIKFKNNREKTSLCYFCTYNQTYRIDKI